MVPGGSFADRSSPAFGQLILVELDPFLDQPVSSPRQGAVEELPVEADPGVMAAVAGMEVRRVVITEEHEDADAVERRDLRHTADTTKQL
jgi:hypothetical protein